MADCGCIGGDTGIENCPSPPPPPPSEPPFDPYNDPYVGDGQGTGDPSFDDLNNITVAPDEPVIDNGVELEEPSILTPASTLRLIGSTRDRNPATGLAPDMQHGFSGDLSGIFWTDYTNRVEYPDSRLFVMMSALMSHCSFLDSDMKLVAGEMVKRFHENQSENTQFSDPVLNSRVFNSSAFKNFMKLF
jgi:hypothetical protein